MVGLYILSLAVLAISASVGLDIRSAFDDAWPRFPYLAPSHALLIYVQLPVVFLASIYFWLSPGLALALRFASPKRFGEWIVLSFVLAIPVQVGSEYVVKLLLGFPVDRGGFLFVSFAIGMAAWATLWLCNRDGVGMPLNSKTDVRRAIISLAILLAALLPLVPYIFWQDFNPDGVEALMITDSLTWNFLPHWLGSNEYLGLEAGLIPQSYRSQFF